MSRSIPTVGTSPAVRFFEWSAEGGLLQYYDKDQKLNVTVKFPFSFMVLDEVSQIGGGIKANNVYVGYWSNAVKNLDTQIITVKSKQGIVAQGLYSQLKQRKGLHYVKGLYIAFFDENKEMQIGYLKFKGSSLGAWFDFTKTHKNIYQGAFAITGPSEPHQGQNGDYYTPAFTHKAEISAESDHRAIELDGVVQEYLKAYFANKGTEETTESTNGNAMAATAGGTETHETYSDGDGADEDDDPIPF